MPYLPRNEKIYAFEHIQQLFLRLTTIKKTSFISI